MGFLHKLWDETLAGPAPETGLGKLRKYDSFSASRSPPMIQDPIITRSITIVRTNSNLIRNISVDPGSVPQSPSGSSTPASPLSPGTPREYLKKLTRRKSSAEALERAERRSPTV